MPSDEWFMVSRRRPGAPIRMICFPHAGAGGGVYRGWPAILPEWIEVCTAQLPGREARLGELAVSDLSELMPHLLAGIEPHLGAHEFVLFGHSMGALIAYELGRALVRQGGPLPSALVVSGRRAPHKHRTRLDVARMSTGDLLALLERYGGTPQKLLTDPGFMEYLLPTLRADLTLVESYSPGAGPPFSFPILAYGGSRDSQVTTTEIEAWSMHTIAEFKARIFDNASDLRGFRVSWLGDSWLRSVTQGGGGGAGTLRPG